MINLILAFLLIAFVFWVSKKFYFPLKVAEHPERYDIITEKLSKRELEAVLKHLQRWKQCGQITREEYDNLTDIALRELQTLNEQNQDSNLPPQGDDHV